MPFSSGVFLSACVVSDNPDDIPKDEQKINYNKYTFRDWIIRFEYSRACCSSFFEQICRSKFEFRVWVLRFAFWVLGAFWTRFLIMHACIGGSAKPRLHTSFQNFANIHAKIFPPWPTTFRIYFEMPSSRIECIILPGKDAVVRWMFDAFLPYLLDPGRLLPLGRLLPMASRLRRTFRMKMFWLQVAM